MNDRIISVYRDGKWQTVEFFELRLGDQFAIFEPNGEIVLSDEGYAFFEVVSKPYKEDNEWIVEVEPVS